MAEAKVVLWKKLLPPLMDRVKVFLGDQILQMPAPNCIRLAKDTLLGGGEWGRKLVFVSLFFQLIWPLKGKVEATEALFQEKLFLRATGSALRLH